MAKFYFTFGSDPEYPYGRNDYVEVEADGLNEACLLFNLVHPPREGSDLINCAFFYSEESFNKFREKYYQNRQPIEKISLKIEKS